jgi:hypothetical protein
MGPGGPGGFDVRKLVSGAILFAAFATGFASGQGEEPEDASSGLEERLAQVRREVKHIDLTSSIGKVPALVARETAYEAVLREAHAAAGKGEGGLPGMLEQARDMKLAALAELNEILKKHSGEHAGIAESEVWKRLHDARFANVSYRDEWLVNILDDLEGEAKVNIEMDARVYKFDTVSFHFDKTSALSMLEIMGDTLLFEWIVRGDTLYVYKENHEELFGGEWIVQKKKAWKARKDTFEAAIKEAERRALEEAEREEAGK